ncbi:uncharacterized protein TRIADDRAFT_61232 [Trichoplax adhaerens]|uniref:CARD domain-containing protein n=1 Tax=Trichoplax adhaerens TaxID=10228 RepID=B3SAE5_TRIAD|nr:predicted protein [Trichoplax adhaerens]EDV20298.1 predicted protein [Trichoplax adhaerens]|eukprot:XP_002117248.1 predicted protein [Trichoplax adhaerens]
MVLSQYITDVINKNRRIISNDVPLLDLIYDLNSEMIISDDELVKLRDKCDNNKQRAFEFIQLLKSRNDENFFQFCSILKEAQVQHVQNIGQKLENEAKATKICDDENLLRNLPIIPESDYITRNEFVNTICSELKRIHENSGHILVHGMAGSGKSVAVCQSVRRSIEADNYFKPHGCYWIKIGNISDEKLLSILKNLSVRLGIVWVQSPQTLDEISAKIDRFLQDNSEIARTLFIFDDIWNERHYDYVAFAKKSVATSRFNYARNKISHILIPTREQFTDDEAMALIAKRREYDCHQTFLNSDTVKNVIKSCAALPLAISIIAGLDLQSDEEWEEIRKRICSKDLMNDLPDYELNVFNTLDLSVSKLNDSEKSLFRLLGVFRAVEIPLASVICLWKIEITKGIELLKMLNRRSLLKYSGGKRRYVVLHDLMIQYLQQSTISNLSRQEYHKSLNKELIDGYFAGCGGNWSSYKDDGYFYQYLIYHVIQAEADDILHQVMTDFNWMMIKIRTDDTIYNLSQDVNNYIDYLRKGNKDWHEFNQLLDLLKQHEFSIDKYDMDVIQTLLWYGERDSMMRERAVQLARINTQTDDSVYWIMFLISGNTVTEYTYNASKRFGKNFRDDSISISNPNSGNWRIVGTENNGTTDCQIIVKDHQTSHIVYQMSPSYRYISSVEISADGCIIAFRYRDDKNNSVMITVSSNRCLVKLWRITDDREIKSENKLVSYNYKIESCLWIKCGSQILLWWRRYNFDKHRDNYKPLDVNNWINECNIEVWSLKAWHLLRSVTVPAYIGRTCNQYTATTNIEGGQPLVCVNSISNDAALMILAYKNIVGLVNLERKDHDPEICRKGFAKNFRLTLDLSHSSSVANITISDDQQFVAINCVKSSDENIYLMTIRNNQIRSYMKINMAHAKSLTFMPDTAVLFVYESSSENCLYEYNLQDDNLRWQNFQNNKAIQDYLTQEESQRVETQILDVNYAYINGVPFVAQLIENDTTCKLEIREYEAKLCVRKFYHSLENGYYRCFLYNDFRSAVVVRFYRQNLGLNMVIAEIIDFCSEKDRTEIKKLLDHNISLRGRIFDLKTRYRGRDNTLIFVVSTKGDGGGLGMIIITINLETEEKMIYQEESRYRSMDLLYYDDDYLVTCQTERKERMKDELDHEHSIKCYKFGDGKSQIQLLERCSFDSQHGLIYKLTLPTNLSHYKLDIKYSSLNLDTGKLLEEWGEKDGNLLMTHAGSLWKYQYICLLEKGEHLAILNGWGRVKMKRYKNNIVKFDFDTSIFNCENLWSDKFLIVLEDNSLHIHIYEAQTLQLCRVLPLSHLDMWYMKWNCQQSSFIVSNMNRDRVLRALAVAQFRSFTALLQI